MRMSACLVLLTVVVTGCDPDDSSQDGTTEPADGGDAGQSCPEPSAGPSLHEGEIVEDEVWTAAGSPHVLTGTVGVYAKLTIEPCARVEVDDNGSLIIGADGTLEAVGEENQGITFTAHAQGVWGPLRVEQEGRANLAHVLVEKGGADALTWKGCSLVASAPNATPLRELLKVDHVTVEGSAGIGVCLLGGAAFVDGSQALTIRGSGASTAVEFAGLDQPMLISSAAIATIPDGTYSGNARDAIHVDPFLGIPGDVHVRNLGVPYDIDYGTGVGLEVGTDDSSATLTLDPGVVLRFDALGKLVVTENGVLHAQGSASAPVVFGSSAATPSAGDWIGVFFEGPPAAESSVSHAVVEYAGAPCSCIGYSCESDGYGEDAAIEILGWKPSGSFVTNTTIRSSAAHGINRGWESDLPEPDFAASNTFAAVALCAQTTPRPLSTECPSVMCP